MSAHAAVVLAAGRSTRLGEPKQLLRRNGETLIHRAVRLGLATSPALMLVVVGADAERVGAELQSVDCEVLRNDRWHEGLASSLIVAANALAGFEGPVLILGCDQPAMELEHLDALLAGANGSGSGVAATLHAGLPGIPAVVPSGWFVDSTLNGDTGFGSRLRATPAATLFILAEPVLELDIDTQEDVQLAAARGWIGLGS